MGLIERSFSADSDSFYRDLGQASRVLPTVSILFAPGCRPSAEQLRVLSASGAPVTGSVPEGTEGHKSVGQQRDWLEVLANGLAFDVSGLSPGICEPSPPALHRYGLSPALDIGALEAVSIRPAPDAASDSQTLPVIRSLAWLAAILAELPDVCAVAWHPAQTLSAPGHFRGSVLRWIDGGAFPGLGLTALVAGDDGSMRSEGLALLTGQEIELAMELAEDRAAAARLALRLLHWLVEYGPLETPVELCGPSEEILKLSPAPGRPVIEVSLAGSIAAPASALETIY